MKRILLAFIAVCLWIMPGLANAALQSPSSGYEYEIKLDGTVCITNYQGKYSGNDPSQHIVIPSEIDGRTVTEIGKEAFASGYSVYEIVVPGCVKVIGRDAFAFSGVHRVTLEEGVERIESNAFGFSPLEYIHLPESLKHIGNGAFTQCSLTDIDIPDGVEEIESRAFSSCEKLKSVRIPQGISKIGFGMFSGCILLEKAELHDGITMIEGDAFEDCISLKEIRLPDNAQLLIEESALIGSGIQQIQIGRKNARYQVMGDVLYDLENMTALYALKSGNAHFSIFPGITRFAEGAFVGHPYLESIVLPDSLTCIEEETFLNCVSLRHVELPRTLEEIGKSAFEGCADLEEIVFPQELQRIGDCAFRGCMALSRVVVPGNVKELGDEVFSKCGNLKELVLSEGIESIESLLLYGCAGISKVLIPRSVRSIDDIVSDMGVTVYVYRDSAAHECVRKKHQNFVVIDDAADMPETGSGVGDLTGKQWAVFMADSEIRIWIDETRMYHNDQKNSHTTVSTISEYSIDGPRITSDFFGRANPSLNYRFLSDDMMMLTDMSGHNCRAVLVRVPGDEGTGLIGQWNAYRYQATYIFGDDGVAEETGNIYRDELDGPFELEYWTDGEMVRISDGKTQQYYTCHRQSEHVIQAVTRHENGYFVAVDDLAPMPLNTAAPQTMNGHETALKGQIQSFDRERGTWPDTYRYRLLDAVFYYRESERIPGGAVITEVRIDEASVEEYRIQSLAFPTTVDGKTVVGIDSGCCQNMLEIGDIAWPQELQYIGNRAFAGCANLEGVFLPASVTSIGEFAFADCDLWEGVTIPEQAEVGLGAFVGTSNGTPDGYVFVIDSRGETTPVEFGRHCPQAIRRNKSDISAYIQAKMEEEGL